MGKLAYQIIIFIGIVSVLIFLNGCIDISKEEMKVEKMQKEEKQTKLTKEYACNELGVDEKLLEDVDFEVFVNYYNIYDDVTKESVELSLEYFKAKDMLLTDYDQIFANIEQVELTEERMENVGIIFWKEVSEGQHKVMVYDFVFGKIIRGQHSNTVLEDDIVGNADENTLIVVTELLEKYDAYSWSQKDNLKVDVPMSENVLWDDVSSWSFKIKFNDGTMYCLRGDTLTDDSAPKNFDKFVEELKSLALTQYTQ